MKEHSSYTQKPDWGSRWLDSDSDFGLRRPDNPWDPALYTPDSGTDLKELQGMTAQEMLDDPWTVGRLTRFTPAALGNALGINFVVTNTESLTFGWVSGDNDAPHVWMPGSGFSPEIVKSSSNALLHYLFTHLALLSDWCGCCDGSEVYLHPCSVTGLTHRMSKNYWKTGFLPNHFFEATVWARIFMRTNRLYQEPMQAIVIDQDRKHDFWMPDFRGVGETRRTELLWKNTGYQKSLLARIQSPMKGGR